MPVLKDSLNEREHTRFLQKLRHDGKVVVITGGAGILGTVFAEGFLELGARVALLDVNSEALQDKEKLFHVDRRNLIGITCDLTDKQAVTTAFAKVMEAWGKIDVLVNAAAAKSANFFESIENYFLEDWHAVLESNLTSMFLCTQAVLKVMQQQKSGAIVNIGSIYGEVAPDYRIYEGSEYEGRPINTPVTYAVTKGSVANFTPYLAVTQAPYGIRANAVSPGGVYSGQNETFVKNYSSRSPMGRMAEREEIAGAVLFLASDAASYITGQNLMADGGWTAW